MPKQGSYPLGARTPAVTDTLTAVVAGATADLPISALSTVLQSSFVNVVGLRNRIINGDMRVAQRGFPAAVANTFIYGQVDRILWSIAGTLSAGNIVQLTGVSGGSNGYSSALSSFSATVVTGAYTQTRIEAVNSVNLNSKTITVSCKVYQDTGATITVTPYLAKPPTTTDTFTNSPTTVVSGTGVSVPSGTLTTVTATYTLGASDATLGLAPSLSWGVSGTYTTKNLCVTDWQLEVGSVATPFEQRPYGMELALCQRYALDVATLSGIAFANSTTSAYVNFVFPVSMRAAPTLSAIVGNAGIFNGSSFTTTTLPILNSATTGYTILGFSGFAGLTTATPYFYNPSFMTSKIMLVSEL